MKQKSAIVVPQQATRTLSDPASSHTIADRKHLTEDALKLSEHELKKELNRRVEEAKEVVAQRWEEMDPYFAAYNKAVKQIAGSLVGSLEDDIGFSFRCLNRLGCVTEYGRRDGSSRYEVTVEMNEPMTLFWCSDVNKTFKDGYVAHLNKPRYLGIAMAQEIVELVKAEESASDLDIMIDITVEEVTVDDDDAQDEDSKTDTVFEATRILQATGSSELMEARIAIATAYAPYAEAVEKLGLAKKDLENLPGMMKELEMQATAQRLQDAGGQSLLMGVLHGVSRLLQGEQISGLHLAVPEAKQTIMGAPDEHGPESTDAPETPVAETPAADEASSEGTTAPAEEAAAADSPAEDTSAGEQQ